MVFRCIFVCGVSGKIRLTVKGSRVSAARALFTRKRIIFLVEFLNKTIPYIQARVRLSNEKRIRSKG